MNFHWSGRYEKWDNLDVNIENLILKNKFTFSFHKTAKLRFQVSPSEKNQGGKFFSVSNNSPEKETKNL